MAELPSFQRLHNIPLCLYTTFYFSIYSPMDIHFWLLWIRPQWTLAYKYLFKTLLSLLLDIYVLCVLSHFSRVQLGATQQTIYSLPGSSVHGILQARIGCHFLLQRIFPTQGSNPCFLCPLHWQVGSLPLAPHRKPDIYLEEELLNYVVILFLIFYGISIVSK